MHGHMNGKRFNAVDNCLQYYRKLPKHVQVMSNCALFRCGRSTLSTAVTCHFCSLLIATFSAREDGKADGRRTNNKITIIQSNAVCILYYIMLCYVTLYYIVLYIIKNHTHA
jgi:hypothetical protein